jgi:hypothetical protein
MKIGDRVRATSNLLHYIKQGDKGTIIEINYKGFKNTHLIKFDNGNKRIRSESGLELIETPNPLKELSDLIISFMKTVEATSKETAIPQATVAHYCNTTEREVRRANEFINDSLEYDLIVNRCNNGNYITRSKQDLSNMRNREIRKLKQAIKRIKKTDYLNNDNQQFNINELLEELK